MYSHEQLKLMDAAAISISSQRHIQSVIEELIETAIAAAQTPAEAPADVARDAELLRKLKHSIGQAMIPGNDWRRELALMNGAIDAAMSEKGGA